MSQAGSVSQVEAAGTAGASGTGQEAGSTGDVSAAGLADPGPDEPGSSAGSAGAGTTEPTGNILTAVSWKVIAESTDSPVSAGMPSAASDGHHAAVAYIERTVTATTDTARVVMQRFDASGDRVGSPVVLGVDPDLQSNVSLASDGTQYAACWNTAPEVHCSLVDDQGKVRTNALAIPGEYATIIGTTAGWALAYSGDQKTVRLQALTPSLTLNRKLVDLRMFAQFQSRDLGPLFVATPSGYALVASDTAGGEASLLRLGSDLMPIGAAVPLEHPLSYSGRLVASDTRAAASLSAPYGSYLLLLDARKLSAELAIAGGGKTGTDQALSLMTGGIGAAWLDRAGMVHRRFLADGHDADIGLTARTPPSQLLGSEEEGTDSYQQLLRVEDRNLLVARAQRYGSLAGINAIRVAALKFQE